MDWLRALMPLITLLCGMSIGWSAHGLYRLRTIRRALHGRLRLD